jgi:WD40 repeat protein
MCVSGSKDNTLRVWNPETQKTVQTLRGHTNSVIAITALPNGNCVSGSEDKTLRLWNTDTGEMIRSFPTNLDYFIAIAGLPDGNFVTNNDENGFTVWNSKTGERIQNYVGKHTNLIYCLTTLKNGTVVSGSGDGTLQSWNIQTGESIQVFRGHPAGVYLCDSLPNGNFVSCDFNGILKVWNAETGDCIRTMTPYEMNNDGYEVDCISVIDNKYVAVGGCDSTLRIWNIRTGQNIHTFTGYPTYDTDCFLSLTTLQDGTVVSGYKGNEILMWNVPSKSVMQEFKILPPFENHKKFPGGNNYREALESFSVAKTRGGSRRAKLIKKRTLKNKKRYNRV